MLPFAALGGYFTGKYAYASYTQEVQQMIISQVGSIQLLAVVTMVQSVAYAFIFGGIGYLLADKIGLMKPVRYEKDKLKKALVLTLCGGVILGMDYGVFGKILPEVAALYESGLLVFSLDNWISSVFYGGIVEELLLRLFFMSLIAWIIWKCFFRKCTKEEIPEGVFVAANIISALVFAAGHLPTTISMFGGLTLLIIFRCFLLNGVLGILFGRM